MYGLRRPNLEVQLSASTPAPGSEPLTVASPIPTYRSMAALSALKVGQQRKPLPCSTLRDPATTDTVTLPTFQKNAVWYNFLYAP